MNLVSYFKELLQETRYLENKIETGSKFSQKEINEILRTAKVENIKYFEKLSQMRKLSAFDVSFILSSVDLDDEKIKIIQKAISLYNENEFKQVGQTLSDFIFRVSANIDMISYDSLDVFKELVNSKNEVYDFTQIIKNPAKSYKKQTKKMGYAFQRVLVD